MKGYQANAAIHEAVEYIKSLLMGIDIRSGYGQDLVHLLDILGAEAPED